MDTTVTITNGRDKRGRFLPGNTFSRPENNPLCRSVWRLKQAAISACTPEEMTAVVRRLLALCHDPDGKVALQAIELLMDRFFGKPRGQLEIEVGQGQPAFNPSALSAGELETLLTLTERAMG